MKKHSYILFLLFHGFFVAQNQTINWNFGNKAGLNFNNGIANVLPNSEMNTPAGCSTISDKEGNLLFYTNGQTVWNKNHQIMENGEGLAGEIDVTQSTIIIPKPGNEEIYYVFSTRVSTTTTSPVIPKGVYVTEVEISATFPLGKVLYAFLPLRDSSTERITAVHHKDGKAIWVIIFGETGGSTDGAKNRFSFFKIDETGINPPINTIAEETQSSIGAMKVSPDGKFIAVADYSEQFIYLYNFDTETADIDFEQRIFCDTAPFSPKNPYGLAFSRDSKILYFTGLVGTSLASLNQFTLENPFPDDPLYSPKLELFSTTDFFLGSLQLANDSNIYVSLSDNGTGEDIISSEKIGVITEPEKLAFESDYRHNTFSLQPGASNKGLPNFIQSYFASRILTKNECVGDVFSFDAVSYATISNIEWDFGDGNTANGLTTSHTYNTPGNYSVKATLNVVGEPVVIYENIIVYSLPNLIPNQELTQCDTDNDGIQNFNLFNIGEKISLNYNNENFKFYRTNSDAVLDINQINNPEDFTNTVPNQEIFTRVINQNNCENISSFFLKAQFVQLGPISPMFVCEDSDSIVGNAKGEFNFRDKERDLKVELNLPDTSIFTFYPAFDDAILKTNQLEVRFVTNSTTVWVRVDDSLLGCNGIQSFELVVNDEPIINIEEAYIICFDIDNNPPVILTSDAANSRFEWRNENNALISTQQTFRLTQPGNYTHIAYKTQNGIECSNTKTFSVKIKESPIFNEISVDTSTENITVDVAVNGNSSYQFSLDNVNFSGSGTNFTFTNVNPGIVTVYVEDVNNCEPPIQQNVSVIGFPDFFTPNNDGNNDTWSVKGATTNFFSFIDITIFNRFGVTLHEITNTNNTPWDGNYRGLTLPSGEYWYKANLIDLKGNVINKTGNFSLLRP